MYDTSTFTQNPDGSWNHQATHSADALFWLPTRDQWTKTGYWDPDLNDGEGGYYLFPNGSSEQSIPGVERNAWSGDYPMDVGSFPNVMSPWGILGMEGGAEWTESVVSMNPHIRYLIGSNSGDAAYGELIARDMLGRSGDSFVFAPVGGIRLVSVVPAPSTSAVFVFGIGAYLRRKRPE